MKWKIINNKWHYSAKAGFCGDRWHNTGLDANICGLECAKKHFFNKKPNDNCKTQCPFGVKNGR